MMIKEDLGFMLKRVVQEESEDDLEEFHETLCAITYSCIIDSHEEGKDRIRLVHVLEDACLRIRRALEDKRIDYKKRSPMFQMLDQSD